MTFLCHLQSVLSLSLEGILPSHRQPCLAYCLAEVFEKQRLQLVIIQVVDVFA